MTSRARCGSGDGRTARCGGSSDLRPLVLEFLDDGAKGGDQFFARNLTLAELDAHAEGFILRLVVEDERLRARAGGLFFPALFAGFVASQAATRDALQRLGHFLRVGLARDLEKKRAGRNSLLEAAAAE